MKVLVTGAAGFIGSAVKRSLERSGHEWVSFDHPDDIRDLPAVIRAVNSVDGVIHLAGMLGTSELLGHEYEAIDVNIIGALNVLDACKDKPLVYIATGHRGQLNTYAVTKACAEDIAKSRAMWQGQPVNIVRAFHAYGPGQKAPEPHGKSIVRKIIPSFVCRAITGMPIEIWGDGSQLIDLVHVDDVADCLVAGLEGPYGRTLEAGTGVPTTVTKAAELVIELCNSTSEIVYLPMRSGEPERSVVVANDPWECKIGLREGLEATIPWYREYLG